MVSRSRRRESERRGQRSGFLAYAARPTNTRTEDGDDAWHGYPEEWSAVPPQVVEQWLLAGSVERRTLRRALR